MDLLYQAAVAWKEIIDYQYHITFGYKQQLFTLHLSFAPEEFAHLAGFQYMKDLSLPNYSSARIVDRILDGRLSGLQIAKARRYDDMIRPRLQALMNLRKALDDEFSLYAYSPRVYPFYTSIKADYLFVSHSDESYVFVIRAGVPERAENAFSCCSIFRQDSRDYTINQRSRTILRKERIYIPTNSATVLYNRLA